jgi:hypothetical protein
MGGAMLLLGAAPAHAQTEFEANVPFPFAIASEQLPAGKYMISRDEIDPSVLLIRGEKRNDTPIFVRTTPDYGSDPAGQKPALTFKQDGNEYRLTNVWVAPTDGADVIHWRR